jgi:hypothetical protein
MLAPSLMWGLRTFHADGSLTADEDLCLQLIQAALETAATIPIPRRRPKLMERRLAMRIYNRVSRWLKVVAQEPPLSLEDDQALVDALTYQRWLADEVARDAEPKLTYLQRRKLAGRRPQKKRAAERQRGASDRV